MNEKVKLRKNTAPTGPEVTLPQGVWEPLLQTLPPGLDCGSSGIRDSFGAPFPFAWLPTPPAAVMLGEVGCTLCQGQSELEAAQLRVTKSEMRGLPFLPNRCLMSTERISGGMVNAWVNE